MESNFYKTISIYALSPSFEGMGIRDNCYEDGTKIRGRRGAKSNLYNNSTLSKEMQKIKMRGKRSLRNQLYII